MVLDLGIWDDCSMEYAYIPRFGVRDYDAEITLRRECQRLVETLAAEVDASSEACVALRLTAGMVDTPHSIYQWIYWVRIFGDFLEHCDLGGPSIRLPPDANTSIAS